jgi:hypothetical protein
MSAFLNGFSLAFESGLVGKNTGLKKKKQPSGFLFFVFLVFFYLPG